MYFPTFKISEIGVVKLATDGTLYGFGTFLVFSSEIDLYLVILGKLGIMKYLGTTA